MLEKVRRSFISAPIAVVVGAAACGPAPLPAGTCEAFVDAYCGKLADCDPYKLEVDFGADRTSALAGCKTRMALACDVEAKAGDRIDIVACTSAMPTAACDDVAAGALPFACHTRRVAVAGDAGTGTCEEKAPVGAPCVTPPEGTLPCEDDAICDAISGKCVARGHAGDACSTDTRCRPMLYCNNASDPTKPGVCVARGNAGDACSYTSPCDHVQLLTCQGACAASDLSATQCGATYELPCASNGYCFLYSGGGGMCYAAAGDGEVCGYGTCDQRTPGDQPCITCLPPARCLGGRCKITGIDCR